MKLAEALLLQVINKKNYFTKTTYQCKCIGTRWWSTIWRSKWTTKTSIFFNSRISKLSYAIHETNALTKLNDGRSLLALLTLRDEFVEQHKTLTAAISNTSRESDRYSTREIKWHKVIPVSSLQNKLMILVLNYVI